MQKLKITSLVLLIIVAVSPFVGAAILNMDLPDPVQGFASIQPFIMAIFNAPFFLLSISTYFIAESMLKKQKNKPALTLFIISLVSSVAGTLSMALWTASGLIA